MKAPLIEVMVREGEVQRCTTRGIMGRLGDGSCSCERGRSGKKRDTRPSLRDGHVHEAFHLLGDVQIKHQHCSPANSNREPQDDDHQLDGDVCHDGQRQMSTNGWSICEAWRARVGDSLMSPACRRIQPSHAMWPDSCAINKFATARLAEGARQRLSLVPCWVGGLAGDALLSFTSQPPARGDISRTGCNDHVLRGGAKSRISLSHRLQCCYGYRVTVDTAAALAMQGLCTAILLLRKSQQSRIPPQAGTGLRRVRGSRVEGGLVS